MRTFTWNESEMGLFVDGRRTGGQQDGYSPLKAAIKGGGTGRKTITMP